MIGELVGSYRIVSRLGQGGMGVVYLAEHPLLGKRAVVKQLLPELSQDQQIVQRFFNEARAATMIKHPGIVDVFDFGYLANGAAFIVMEFLDGESLATRLEKQRPQPAEAVALFGKQVARAVGAAHGEHIVHRDLKPDNIYLVAEPDAPNGIRVKVLDFGIAKLVNNTEALKTRAGSVMGTPAYMSPEQCQGAVTLDHRTDIYALGCIFFELITGGPPFPFEGLGEILIAHMSYPPPSPASLNPACPPALEQLILQMLAKNPDERPQTMEDVARRLDAPMFHAPATIPLPPKTMAAVPIGAPIPTPSPSPSTTLGASVGQAVAHSQPPTTKSAAPKILAGVGLLGIVAVVGVVAATRGGEKAVSTPSGERSVADAREKRFGPGRDPIAARAAFEASCTAGDKPSCGRLAAMARIGDGGPVRSAEALRLAEGGCAAHDAMSCAVLAEIRRTTDPTAARKAAVEACDAKEGLGCATAVMLDLLADDRTAADAHHEAANSLLRPRCTAGDDEACVALGALERRANRYGQALALFRESCNRRYADACVELGAMYELAEGVAADAALGTQTIREIVHCTSSACAEQAISNARDITDRRNPDALAAPLTSACDDGHGRACAALASIYAFEKTGRDAAQLFKTAARLFEQHCKGADSRSCIRGAALASALGDPKRAASLNDIGCRLGNFEGCPSKLAGAACDAGNMTACVSLGRALAGENKIDKAIELLDRACEKKLATGCYGAASLRSLGDKDAAAKRERFIKLCDEDNALACSAAATLEAQTDAALSLAEKGCAGGAKDGCERIVAIVKDKKSEIAIRARTRGCILGDVTACL